MLHHCVYLIKRVEFFTDSRYENLVWKVQFTLYECYECEIFVSENVVGQSCHGCSPLAA